MKHDSECADCTNPHVDGSHFCGPCLNDIPPGPAAPTFPESFVATNNVMTPAGVVSVVTWEAGGKSYLVTGTDIGLALAAAAQLETERREQS